MGIMENRMEITISGLMLFTADSASEDFVLSVLQFQPPLRAGAYCYCLLYPCLTSKHPF